MNKIIATYNDNKIITRLVDNDKSLISKNDKYKIFDNSLQLTIGTSIDCYDDKGTRYSNSILQEKGLLKLSDDEVLENETIREKTEIEKYNDDPNSETNITKVIDTDEQGGAYLREKNMLEKYNDALISKDDYNVWVIEQRENEYSYTTDKMNSRLLYDSGLSVADKTNLQNEIENKKSEIKQKYIKL